MTIECSLLRESQSPVALCRRPGRECGPGKFVYLCESVLGNETFFLIKGSSVLGSRMLSGLAIYLHNDPNFSGNTTLSVLKNIDMIVS